MMLILILLPVAFLLPAGAGAGEIIGGEEAQPHSRPYMAYLKIQNGKEIFRCGGFLVSMDFVLTAAHCNGEKITVYLGAHNINKLWDWRQKKILVAVKIPHPRYNNKTYNNDIMLLQLKKKAEVNKRISPICLPRARQSVPPGTECSVAGWGRTSPRSQRLPDKLREVDVMVMPDDDCPRIPNGPDYNPSAMLCAGDPEEGKNAFKGDSGGPLVCEGKAEGIVSWGHPDGKPPGVYTKVSTFIPWIEKMMKKLQP